MQDKTDNATELKAGLQLIQKCFSGLTIKKAQTSAASEFSPTDDEKYTIYGLFDGLNFLFGLADFKHL